jgi:hypothetical protein
LVIHFKYLLVIIQPQIKTKKNIEFRQDDSLASGMKKIGRALLIIFEIRTYP